MTSWPVSMRACLRAAASSMRSFGMPDSIALATAVGGWRKLNESTGSDAGWQANPWRPLTASKCLDFIDDGEGRCGKILPRAQVGRATEALHPPHVTPRTSVSASMRYEPPQGSTTFVMPLYSSRTRRASGSGRDSSLAARAPRPQQHVRLLLDDELRGSSDPRGKLRGQAQRLVKRVCVETLSPAHDGSESLNRRPYNTAIRGVRNDGGPSCRSLVPPPLKTSSHLLYGSCSVSESETRRHADVWSEHHSGRERGAVTHSRWFGSACANCSSGNEIRGGALCVLGRGSPPNPQSYAQQ